jgi:hypothetical protein
VLSRSYERPLPWDERASEAAEVLRATVVAWVRIAVEEGNVRCPSDDMGAMSRTLLAGLEWLRHHDAADECADEIGHAVTMARRVIDAPPGRLYAGPCDPKGEFGDACPTDLYAREGATEVVCPACELVWNVKNRRDYLVDSAGDRLATAADLSRFLTMYGEPIKQDRIRKWASRKDDDTPPVLVSHGKDAAGRPMYRVDDVVKLLTEGLPKRGRVA